MAKTVTIMRNLMNMPRPSGLGLSIDVKILRSVERMVLITSEVSANAAGIDYDIRMKQLYHDREEITCIVITR